jgi:DedD protein
MRFAARMIAMALAAGAAAFAAAQSADGEYGALLSHASTLPPKDALKMADSLSRAPTAPGRVKAMGLRITGDHNFLKEEYKAAADAYSQALKLDSSSTYRHRYALAIAMNGQPEAAREIWNRIALDKADSMSGEAALMLTHLPKPPEVQPTAPNNQQPAPVTAAAKVDEAKAPPPAIPASQPESAPIVSTTEKVDDKKTPPPAVTAPPVNQQNSRPATTPAAVTKIDVPKKQPPAAPPVNQPNNAPVGIYTIQVGAFASKENADNLVARLKGKYEDITVSTTASGDQTLYRVRVGSFPRKEEAAAFADKLIIEAGLSARVTEK